MSDESRLPRNFQQSYGVVRDAKTGMPKVDEPQTVPDVIWKSFTQEEKNHINNSVLEHLRRYD